ncbi:MAG: sulfatase [Actinomycetota bacterium]
MILTDDQRADTLDVMPHVRRELGGKGVTFPDAVVVNPLCCPSRATILTGRYSHATGVYANVPPHGGFEAFDDSSTIATALQGAGYRTALIGKYLNGYSRAQAGVVPPGWDRWFATTGDAYYGFGVSDQGALGFAGLDEASYSTTFLTDAALRFIRETDPSQPFFLYLAFHAPHFPSRPAPRDAEAFSGLPPFRPASYDEPDVSDKPGWVRNQPPLTTAARREIDEVRRDMLRTLLEVDRSVKRIVDQLGRDGRIRDTLIVFSSDNGYLWGEHRLKGKSAAYEESIGVPLVVRFDAVVQAARTDRHLVSNIDFAPTFADAAGIDPPDADGASLMALLRDADAPWREDVLIEHTHGVGGSADEIDPPTYCAVRSTRHLLVAYETGDEELYDLTRDPQQLDNRVADAAMTRVLRGLRERLRDLCNPPPPGFSVP